MFGFLPADRMLFSLSSTSNQNGAPSETANAVMSKPIILVTQDPVFESPLSASHHPTGSRSSCA